MNPAIIGLTPTNADLVVPKLDGERQLSREEVLTLKVGELLLHKSDVQSAATALLKGVRRAGRSGNQALVLVSDLEALSRAVKQAAPVTWPVFPKNETPPSARGAGDPGQPL